MGVLYVSVPQWIWKRIFSQKAGKMSIHSGSEAFKPSKCVMSGRKFTITVDYVDDTRVKRDLTKH